jgi:tyrosinase
VNLRKNHHELSAGEWKVFIAAIKAMHGTTAAAPAYREFVSLHVQAMSATGMSWLVHTMNMGGMIMRGKNFLCWHRRLLRLFEARLQQIDPAITVPYWNSIEDRAIPAPLADPRLMSQLSVHRQWDPSQLADASDVAAVQRYSGSFRGFQALLEGAVHGGTHNAIGGDMAGPASPTDPLFWLHHAFIDKLWADWQLSAPGKNPPAMSELLRPAEIVAGVRFAVEIDHLIDTATLGYAYA